MRIESLHIMNYKVFRDVVIKNLPNMAVFLGKNGAGKTTLFDIFGFLHDCLVSNVNIAIMKRGGFREVVSRGQEGDITIEVKFRPSYDEPLITYQLVIAQDEGTHKAVVKRETLRLRRGAKGSPWKVLDFSYGEGMAAAGKLRTYQDVNLAEREKQALDSPDILAIKGLGQFKEFEAITDFRRMIEDWYVSDFRIDAARDRHETEYSERLSRTGDNLAAVTQYIFENDKEGFQQILEKMRERVPGITQVEAKETEDGYIVLKFQDGKFKNPFSAKFVSDGTIKMFTYLILLHDRKKHALLCVEEPENQLYPQLLPELAEEFYEYSRQGGQVFISTHSPEFLNAVNLDSIYYLHKHDGFTTVKKLSELSLIRSLCEAGDMPGSLWRQGILPEGIEP